MANTTSQRRRGAGAFGKLAGCRENRQIVRSSWMNMPYGEPSARGEGRGGGEWRQEEPSVVGRGHCYCDYMSSILFKSRIVLMLCWMLRWIADGLHMVIART